MKRASAELAALAAATLLAGPASVKQVCLAMGVSERRSDKAMLYIRAFKDRGLVYVSSYSTRRRPIYAWQPSPWFLPDAPQPPLKWPQRKKAEPKPEQKPAPIISSVFALGAA